MFPGNSVLLFARFNLSTTGAAGIYTRNNFASLLAKENAWLISYHSAFAEKMCKQNIYSRGKNPDDYFQKV